MIKIKQILSKTFFKKWLIESKIERLNSEFYYFLYAYCFFIKIEIMIKKVYKVLLLGSSSRSAMINKAKNLPVESERITGAGMTSFNFELNKDKIVLQLWEAASTEKFRAVLPMYCKDAKGVILVFDFNQKSTFEDISQLLPATRSNCPPNTSYFLIGVKCETEQERQVSEKEAATFARQNHLKYAKFDKKEESTSIFFNVAKYIYNSTQTQSPPPQQTSPKSTPPPSQKEEEKKKFSFWPLHSKKADNNNDHPNEANPKTENHTKEVIHNQSNNDTKNESQHDHNNTEKETPQTPEQKVQSLSHQLIISQKHEKFYHTKADELERQLKELSEKLEQSMNNEKLLTEKVNYLTKKLHTVTLQKIHQEEAIANNSASQQPKKLPIFSVPDIKQLKELKKLGDEQTSSVTEVLKEEKMILKTFDLSNYTKPNQNQNVDETQKSATPENSNDMENTNITENTDAVENEEHAEGDKNDVSNKLDAFVKEIEILNQIENPHIAKIFGFCYGDSSTKPAELLEYVESSLNDVASQLNTSDRVRAIIDISNTMKQVHSKGIIHYTLSPSRILVDGQNRVKLSGFGMANLFDDEFLISKSSHQFIAPELIRKEGSYNDKVDVYSFGSILYFVLTGGELPQISKEEIEEGKKAQIPDSINELSRELIEKCWENDSKERPSFAEIVEKIENNNFKLIDDFDASQLDF